MSKNFFLNSLLIAIFLSASACKINENVVSEKDKEVIGIGGIQVPPPRNFSASELEIGRRICSNLKSKREFFETLTHEKEQFRFRAELRNCDNNVYNSSLFIAAISNANSTDLEYSANRSNYFKDVVTDQSKILKNICDTVVQSDVVSNNILDGSYKYVINLMIAEGFDTYQITKAKKNPNGQYDSISSESVSIISNKNQASAKFIGVEKERIRHTMCDTKRFQSIKQTWVEAITSF